MQIGSTAATALKIGTQDVDALYMGATLVWSKTVAPTITASDSLSGRTLTISVDSTTGTPAPTTALTALTLDGVDVLGDATGTGPWSYEVPDSADGQTIAGTRVFNQSGGSAPSAPGEAAIDTLRSRGWTVTTN